MAMALFLPDTQTPDVLSLTPSTKSNVVSPIKPWGRLYSTYIYLEPVDLERLTFKLGRSEDCDVIITEKKVPMHRVTNISKTHFLISKEDNLVYIYDLSKNGTYLNGTVIGKGNKQILQNNDEIAIGFKGLKVYIFKVLESDDNDYLPPDLRKKYQVSRTLGTGACGEVKLVYDKVTCLPYAVKKIVKAKNSLSAKHHLNHPEKIKSEILILQSLKHPCVIEMREIVETDDSVFMVLEYMDGGELNDLILSVQGLNEDQVKFLFYQMVLAVRYLHDNDIIHRDLKPENVLLKSKLPETVVKISDFGLSKILADENELMKTICGTPNYVAPEVIDRSITFYSQQVDVWSLGVILYYMLAKELPFRSTERSELNKKIMNGTLSFPDETWGDYSFQAKDLVTKMLAVNPNERIKIDEIFMHDWIEKDVKMQHRVEDLLYSEFKTDLYTPESDTSYSPANKRSRLS